MRQYVMTMNNFLGLEERDSKGKQKKEKRKRGELGHHIPPVGILVPEPAGESSRPHTNYFSDM